MHMKRYTMPGFWPLGKKVEKFVITPMPGPHGKRKCVPLLMVLRDVLDFAATAAEAKKILSRGEVMIDKRIVREPKHPVGLMDVLEFPTIKKQFRVMAGRHGLELKVIPAKDAAKKLCSIQGKTLIKGARYQISLHDGRSITVGKETKYKPGDSVMIEIPSQKILAHWQMKPGVPAVIVAGKNIGAGGKVKEVHARQSMLERGRVVLATPDGDIETLRDYVLVGEIK